MLTHQAAVRQRLAAYQSINPFQTNSEHNETNYECKSICINISMNIRNLCRCIRDFRCKIRMRLCD